MRKRLSLTTGLWRTATRKMWAQQMAVKKSSIASLRVKMAAKRNECSGCKQASKGKNSVLAYFKGTLMNEFMAVGLIRIRNIGNRFYNLKLSAHAPKAFHLHRTNLKATYSGVQSSNACCCKHHCFRRAREDKLFFFALAASRIPSQKCLCA